MSHVNFPNHDEDQERDQHNHENNRVRQHYLRAERAVWVQRGPRMPPRGQLYNSHWALSLHNLWISRYTAPANEQPQSQPSYNLRRRMVRHPPIGVSIPIIYFSLRSPRMGNRYPLLLNLVQYPPSFNQQLLLPMPLQLRSPNFPSFPFCMRRQSNRNRIPRSTYPNIARPPAIRRASSHLMRSKSRQRLNQGHVNSEITVDSPQQVKETKKEKDRDDKIDPSDKCEAYKDLYYDKDNDDDDDDFNSNNQAYPNMQILF